MKLSFYKKLTLMFILFVILIIISYFIKINYNETNLLTEKFYSRNKQESLLDGIPYEIDGPGEYIITKNHTRQDTGTIFYIFIPNSTQGIRDNQEIIVKANIVGNVVLRAESQINLRHDHPGLIKTEMGVRNLTIKNIYINKSNWFRYDHQDRTYKTSEAKSGILCQKNFGNNSQNILIENCTCDMYCNFGDQSGGFIGAESCNGGNITFKECHLKLSRTSSRFFGTNPDKYPNYGSNCGGFIGPNSVKLSGKLIIENCRIDGENSAIHNGSGGVIGANCGTIHNTQKTITEEFDIIVKNVTCRFKLIRGYVRTTFIPGFGSAPSSSVTVAAYGSGGICGRDYSNILIENCYVYIKEGIETVSGGICGGNSFGSSLSNYNDFGRAFIKNCLVEFNPDSDAVKIKNNSGGIVPNIKKSFDKNTNPNTHASLNNIYFSINNCMVKGASLENLSGGICGDISGTNIYVSITLCVFIGDIGENCGGLIGKSFDGTHTTISIANSYTYGENNGKGIINNIQHSQNNNLILKNCLIKGVTGSLVDLDDVLIIELPHENDFLNIPSQSGNPAPLLINISIENNFQIANFREFHEKAQNRLDKSDNIDTINSDDISWIKRRDFCWNNLKIYLNYESSRVSDDEQLKYLITKDENKLIRSDDDGVLNELIVICIPEKKLNINNFIEISRDNILVKCDEDTINLENPILVNDSWCGFIKSYSKNNIIIENFHLDCRSDTDTPGSGRLINNNGGILSNTLSNYISGGSKHKYTINDCSFKGILTKNSGGILGTVASLDLTLNDCKFIGEIGEYSGGIIGANSYGSNIEIKKCYSIGEKLSNSGGIVGSNTCSRNRFVKIGGFTYGFDNNNVSNLLIEECYSIGNINANAGGIAGRGLGIPGRNASGIVFTSNIIIKSCYSEGDILNNGGGIVGSDSFFNEISFCYSKGNILGTGCGGISGLNSINYGTLASNLTANNQKSIISNCYYYGDVDNQVLISNQQVGPIVGTNSGTLNFLTIKNSLFRKSLELSNENHNFIDNTTKIDDINSTNNFSFTNDFYEKSFNSIEKDNTENLWTRCLNDNWLLKWQPVVCSTESSSTDCESICSNIKNLDIDNTPLDSLCNCKKCCDGKTGYLFNLCNSLDPYFQDLICSTKQV